MSDKEDTINEEDSSGCDVTNEGTECDGLNVETEFQEMFGVGFAEMLEISCVQCNGDSDSGVDNLISRLCLCHSRLMKADIADKSFALKMSGEQYGVVKRFYDKMKKVEASRKSRQKSKQLSETNWQFD